MLRRKNDYCDNAKDTCERLVEVKPEKSSQTQVAQKAQMYLSTDDGLNIGELASGRKKIRLHHASVQMLLIFLVLI